MISKWLVVAAGLVVARAEEAAPVPARFPVIQDRLGFGWQVTSAGSLFQTGTNVFESAGRLTVNGERFVAERSERVGGRLVFDGTCGADWKVRRETWIDPDRSLACFVETVRHEGEASRRAVIEVAATMTVPWKTWWARDGEAAIEGAPPPASGAFLMFPPREGTTDLVFVLGDGKAPVQPRVLASDKTFVVRYEVELAPGVSLRLGHGMGQRRAGPGEIAAGGGRPRWPGGTPEGFGKVDNFMAEADGQEVEDQEVYGTIDLWTSLGRVQVGRDEVVTMAEGWWTLEDGSRFRAAAVGSEDPGPRGIRGGADREVPEPARGLRLRNGEVWAGRPAGGRVVLRGIDGPVEFPWSEVTWLRRGGNGEIRVGRRNGESWSGAAAGTWFEWERNGTTWKLPWGWVDGY